MTRFRWAAAALLITMAACGGAGNAGAPPSASSPLLHQPLKPISRPTVSGGKVDTEQLAGQVVVIKFFAKYCKPCEKTLPEAERLHASPDVTVIGVAEDESTSDIDYLVQKHALTFPIVHDRGNVIAGRFRVRELPATFVADRTGKVVWVGGDKQATGDLEAVIASVNDR